MDIIKAAQLKLKNDMEEALSGQNPYAVQPTGFEALVSALSAFDQAGVTAHSQYQQGGLLPAIQGYGEGLYSGLRPGLSKLISNLPPVSKNVIPMTWPDYIQELPGNEPTESTMQNFMTRLKGLGIGILTDPTTYLTAGASGIIKKGIGALKRSGAMALLHTPEGIEAASHQMAKEALVASSHLTPGLKGAGKIKPQNIETIFNKIIQNVDEAKSFDLLKQSFKNILGKSLETESPLRWMGKSLPFPTYRQIANTGLADLEAMFKAPIGTQLIRGKEGFEQAYSAAKTRMEQALPDTLKKPPKSSPARGQYNAAKQVVDNYVNEISRITPPNASLNIIIPAGIEKLVTPKIGGGYPLFEKSPVKISGQEFTTYKPGIVPATIYRLASPFNINFRLSGRIAELDRQRRIGETFALQGTYDLGEELAKITTDEKLIKAFPYWREDATRPDKFTWYDVDRKSWKTMTLTPESKAKFEAMDVVYERLHHPKSGEISNLMTEYGLYPEEKRRERYVYHPPEQRTPMEKVATGAVRNIVGTDPSSKPRTFVSFKQAVMAGSIPRTTNAIELAMERYYMAYRTAAQADFVNSIRNEGESLGLLMPKMKNADGTVMKKTLPPIGFRDISTTLHQTGMEGSIVNKTINELKDYYVRDDLFVYLMTNVMSPIDTPGIYTQMLNKVTGLWKPIVTMYNPGYTVRNLFGNVFNASLGGVKSPKRYLEALLLQLPEQMVKIDKIGTLNVANLRSELLEQGIVGHGFFKQDFTGFVNEKILDGLRQSMLIQSKNIPKKVAGTVGKSVRDFNVFVENNARVALYLDRRLKGFSPEESADIANKYLFDYGALTPMESRLKTWIPFYTWSKFNVPLQFEMLMKRPGAYTNIPRVEAMIRGKKQSKDDPVMEWQKEIESLRTNIKGPKGEVYYLNPGMPYQDLTLITKPHEIIGMLNPAIKEAMEQILNIDLFTGKPITPEGVTDSSLQFKKILPGYKKVVPQFLWPLLGIREVTDTKTGEPIMVGNARAFHVWRTAFRPAREAAKAMNDEDTNFLKGLLLWATGQRTFLYPLDEGKARLWKEYERSKTIKATKKKLEQIRR